MKRNILQLRHGLIKVEKRTVSNKKISEQEASLRNRILSQALGLGYGIALPLVLGTLVGVVLDRRFQSSPRYTLVFLSIGLIISMSQLIRLARTK